VKSTMTGTVTSSGRGGTAAAMVQNEQTVEEQSTLEQQPPGRLDHPAWCVVWTVQRINDMNNSISIGLYLAAVNSFITFLVYFMYDFIINKCYRVQNYIKYGRNFLNDSTVHSNRAILKKLCLSPIISAETIGLGSIVQQAKSAINQIFWSGRTYACLFMAI